MPEALERKLKAQAAEKGLSKKRQNAYVYGTLRKTGWKPDREKHVHGGSTHEVVFMDDSALDEVREIDCSEYGKDWEPNTLKESIYGMQPQSHEEDTIEYGRTQNPGQRDTRDSYLSEQNPRIAPNKG